MLSSAKYKVVEGNQLLRFQTVRFITFILQDEMALKDNMKISKYCSRQAIYLYI